MGLLLFIYCFQKSVPSYTFKFFLTCFLFNPQPSFCKPYLQSKTVLNIPAVPFRAVFCSNTVLITAPSSSIQFFCFFDLLPLVPTSTEITLVLLMFYFFFLIFLFNFWYLSIFFLFFFSDSYVSRYRNINYGTNSLILIHYNNIWFPCLYLSVTMDHNI